MTTTQETRMHVPATSFGERIKLLRGARAQSEVARAIGVSREAVSYWESGETKGLKPDNLLAVADYFGVSVRWLVTGRGPPLPPPLAEPDIDPEALRPALEHPGMREIDPHITVDEALAAFDGVQSHLADALGIDRASVNEWVSSGRQFVPPLQAYRLTQMRPDIFGDAPASDKEATLANRLLQARKSSGLTQSQLAEKSGQTQQMISKLESGRSTETAGIVPLAMACGVRPEWLFNGNGAMPTEASTPLTLESITLARAIEALPPETRRHLSALVTALSRLPARNNGGVQ
ncbi:hypothetical protein BH20PSE1_BH20PSE1_01470 [soil metagenome]